MPYRAEPWDTAVNETNKDLTVPTELVTVGRMGINLMSANAAFVYVVFEGQGDVSEATSPHCTAGPLARHTGWEGMTCLCKGPGTERYSGGRQIRV
jgi:hypothetical protein